MGAKRKEEIKQALVAELQQCVDEYLPTVEELDALEAVTKLEKQWVKLRQNQIIPHLEKQRDKVKAMDDHLNNEAQKHKMRVVNDTCASDISYSRPKIYDDGLTYFICDKESELFHPDRDYRHVKILTAFHKYLNQFQKNMDYWINEKRREQSGNEQVEKEFSSFGHKYKYRMNVVLSIGKGAIDAMVFTRKGIFVCAIKHYSSGNDTIRIGADDNFVLDRRVLGNPFEPNIQSVISLEKVLKEHGIEVKTIPVILLSDRNIRFTNHGRKAVMKANAFYEYIESQKLPNSIPNDTLNRIIDIVDDDCKNFYMTYSFDSFEPFEEQFKAGIDRLMEIQDKIEEFYKNIPPIYVKYADEYTRGEKYLKAAGFLVLAVLAICFVKAAWKYIIFFAVMSLFAIGGSNQRNGRY